jgi:hypothetical protein
LISDCGAQQDQAPSSEVTPGTTLPPDHIMHQDAFTSPMEPIKLEFKLAPNTPLCLGLRNSSVEAFANQGLSNRGFVSQHFSFHHSTNAWHSPLCSGSFQLQQGGLDQCSNCTTDSCGNTVKNFQSMFFPMALDLLSPMCSLEKIAIILHCQFAWHWKQMWATGPVIQTPAFRELVQAKATDCVAALIMVGGSTEFASDQERQSTKVCRHRQRSL